MGRLDTTKQAIDANIRQNGNQAITGQIMNNVLNKMVSDVDTELGKLSEDVDAVKVLDIANMLSEDMDGNLFIRAEYLEKVIDATRIAYGGSIYNRIDADVEGYSLVTYTSHYSPTRGNTDVYKDAVRRIIIDTETRSLTTESFFTENPFYRTSEETDLTNRLNVVRAIDTDVEIPEESLNQFRENFGLAKQSEVTELSAEVSGDLIERQVASSGALNYNIYLEPSYSLSKGQELIVKVDNIVANDVFAIYVKSGANNLKSATSTLNAQTLELLYVADNDVVVDRIQLFKNGTIELSCNVSVYTRLGIIYEIGNIESALTDHDAKIAEVKKFADNTSNQVSEIKESNAILTDSLLGELERGAVADSSISGKYVNFVGNLGDLATMSTYLYKVSKGDKFKITLSASSGGAKVYGIYSTEDANSIDSSTLIELGPTVTEASEVLVEIEDDNAKVLAVTMYSVYNVQVFQIVDSLKYDFAVLETLSANKHHYNYDGDNLLVAALDKGKENTYWFKRCMANNLFTFYKVGVRNTSRNYPSTEGITNGVGIVYYNETASDNIGPISMSNGGWAGGNHLKGEQKTAITEKVEIYADGKVVNANEQGYADSIVVVVTNTIFDPSQTTTGTTLTQKLATERVTYSVKGNTIEVGVSLTFENTTNKLAAYYGMQSMFVDENMLLVPNGSANQWTSIDNSTSFSDKKSEYPNINRFIEKSTTRGTYQSTFLQKIGLGKHDNLSANNMIFLRSYAKDYHSCVGTPTDVSGKTIRWNGCYTFFTQPIADDSSLLVYDGYVNGKKAIYIYSFSAYDGVIDLKGCSDIRNIDIVENNGFSNEDIFLSGGGLYLHSESYASMILLVA